MKASVAIKIFLSLALGLLTYSEVVRAADAQIDCSDPKGRYEIDACVTSERDKIEGELSEAYEQTLNEVDKQVAADPQRLVGLKSQFIKAQQAWNVFRENECEAIQIWYTNGSLQYNLYTECMIQHAKVRIETIRKFSVDYIH